MGRYSIVATYTVRIALHEKPVPADPSVAEEKVPEPPTNVELEALITEQLYSTLPYFGADEIGVRVERTDK